MTTERKQITRTRTSYSCKTCRRRKVKCDKTHPTCGGCKRANEICVYAKEDEELRRPASEIEDQGSKKRKGASHNDAVTTEFSSNDLGASLLDQKLSQLNTLIQELNTTVLSSRRRAKLSESTPNQTSRSGLLTPSSEQVTGDTSNTDVSATEKGQFDPTLQDEWNALTKQLNRLKKSLGQSDNQFLQRGVRQPSPERTTVSQTSPKSISAHTSETISQLEAGSFIPPKIGHGWGLKMLFATVSDSLPKTEFLAPSEEDSNVLFRCWLISVYPMFPIISPYVIRTKCQEFLKWYLSEMDKGIPNPDLSFMPLLYAVWYGGITSMSIKGVKKWMPWTTREMIQQGMQIQFERSLEAISYPAKPSIFPLVACVLMHSMSMHDQDHIQNSMKMISAIRVAQNLGLHRDQHLHGLPPQEAEMRRRIWWEIVTLDTAIAVASGMPPLTDEVYFDTAMPSELKASKLESEEARDYLLDLEQTQTSPDRADDPVFNESKSMVFVHFLVAKARYNIAVKTQKLLRINLKATSMTKEDMRNVRLILNEARRDMKSFIDRVPTRGVPELDFVPDASKLGQSILVDHSTAMGESISEDEIDSMTGKEVFSGRGTLVVRQSYRSGLASFHKWARIYLSMMVERLDCISYAPFLKNAKSKLWALARNCVLKQCHGFLHKFNGLASDFELERFRWCWPGMFQPLHASLIVLVDLYERPFSREALSLRALVDKMFSLSAPEAGIIGGDYGVSTAIPLTEGGPEAWTMLRKLRYQAWLKARLNPDFLWTEEDQQKVGVGQPLNQEEAFMKSLREDILHVYNQRQARISDPISNSKPQSQPTSELKSKISDTRAVLPGQLSSQIQEIARAELLHPTMAEISVETSTGLPRDVVDFDTDLNHISKSDTRVEISFLGQLRAHENQQIMPFRLDQSSSTNPKDKDRNETLKPSLEERLRQSWERGQRDPSQIMHVSELIRRIREAQSNRHPQTSITDTVTTGTVTGSTNTGAGIVMGEVTALPRQTRNQNEGTDDHINQTNIQEQEKNASKHPDCGFQVHRDLENLALEDIRIQQQQQHYPQVGESSPHTTSAFYTTVPNFVGVSGSSQLNNGSRTKILPSTLTPPLPPLSSSVAPLVPGNEYFTHHHNNDINDVGDGGGMTTNFNHPSTATPTAFQPDYSNLPAADFSSSSQPYQLSDNNHARGSNADHDDAAFTFDWDQWDQVFGHFPDSEDFTMMHESGGTGTDASANPNPHGGLDLSGDSNMNANMSLDFGMNFGWEGEHPH